MLAVLAVLAVAMPPRHSGTEDLALVAARDPVRCPQPLSLFAVLSAAPPLGTVAWVDGGSQSGAPPRAATAYRGAGLLRSAQCIALSCYSLL